MMGGGGTKVASANPEYTGVTIRTRGTAELMFGRSQHGKLGGGGGLSTSIIAIIHRFSALLSISNFCARLYKQRVCTLRMKLRM